jgi:glycosidase
MFQGILDFWLNRGVDGFNVRDAGYLYEDYDLRDEPGTGSTVSALITEIIYDDIAF